LATRGGGGVSEGEGKRHDKKFMHEVAAAGLGGEGMEGGGGLLGGLAGWSNWSYVGGGGNSDVNVKLSDGVGLDSSAFHGGVELGGDVCVGKEEGAKENLVNGLGSGGGNSGVLTGLVGNPTKARFGGFDDNVSTTYSIIPHSHISMRAHNAHSYIDRDVQGTAVHQVSTLDLNPCQMSIQRTLTLPFTP